MPSNSSERDPQKLAALKDEQAVASSTNIAAALTGDYRPELLFVLSLELALVEFYQTQITECDATIEQCLAGACR